MSSQPQRQQLSPLPYVVQPQPVQPSIVAAQSFLQSPSSPQSDSLVDLQPGADPTANPPPTFAAMSDASALEWQQHMEGQPNFVADPHVVMIPTFHDSSDTSSSLAAASAAPLARYCVGCGASRPLLPPGALPALFCAACGRRHMDG
jgi:hypothetical protein